MNRLLQAVLLLTASAGAVLAQPVIVTPSPLPYAVQNRPYSTELTAQGGNGEYIWGGMGLPSGLEVTSGGVVEGTPTAAPGTYNFDVGVIGGGTATKSFAITIYSQVVVSTTSPLPAATRQSAYSATLTATGGSGGPYTWAVSGSLPAGLSLNPGTGQITGTPTGVASPYSFSVTATDTVGQTSQFRSLSLTVNEQPLSIVTPATLSRAAPGLAYAETLGASGGLPPYTWSVLSGGTGLPNGITLSSGTGVLNGTPTTDGTYTFRLQVSDASTFQPQSQFRDFTLIVNPTLIITTTGLPNGFVGTPYPNTQLAASGGQSPFTWSIVSGSLPAGLSMTSGGVISGTPTSVSNSSFTVQVTDAAGAQAKQTITQARSINILPPQLTISTNSPLPPATRGAAYTQNIVATGGVSPYQFALSEGGGLPPGLMLSSGGALTGTPTTTGTFNFSVEVMDTQENFAVKPFSLQVNEAGPTITTTQLPNGVADASYAAQTLQASGGTGPFTWTISAGSLPNGLNLTSGGVIQGTPTTPGTFAFTARVTDSQSKSDTQELFIVVDAATLSITTGDLPQATLNAPYQHQFTASGGVPPYLWELASGALPNGVTLTPDGKLSGTPTQTGAFTFSIRVSDSAPEVGLAAFRSARSVFKSVFRATRSFTLVVDPGFPLITTMSLPPAQTLVPYTFKLTSAGGVGPYTYAIASGSLPPGLGLSADGQILGLAVEPAVSAVAIRVTDQRGNSTTKAFDFMVNQREQPTLPVAVATSSLPEGAVARVYGLVLYAKDGVAPYQWNISGLPPGLESNFNGEIIGTPTRSGTYSVQITVSDDNGSVASTTLPLVIRPSTIVITTERVPNGRVGSSYSTTVAASGGVAPYAYSVLSGSLPPGLTLSTQGALRGVPTDVGTYSFAIQASDANSERGNRSFTMMVAPAELVITTTQLGGGFLNVPYSGSLSAAGGVLPYRFSASGLPAGLSVDSATGAISGTPTASGSFSVTAQVTDQTNQVATRALTLEISAQVIITTTSVGDFVVGRSASTSLAAMGGRPPYTWSVAGGSLPNGVGLSAEGQITGTPTAAGDYSFTAQVRDQANTTATRTYSGRVVVPLVIVTEAAGPGIIGSPYSQSLAAQGGTPPYRWSVTGALPPGLNLDAQGAITGTPTTAGSFPFTISVSDAGSPAQTAQRSLSIQVGPAQVSGVVIGVPANAQPGQQQNVTVTIDQPFPLALNGTLTLTFAPDAANNADDPAIQFSTGGRSVAFTIPAGQTAALFSVPTLALQTGTTAGTITITTVLMAGSTPVGCNCALTRTIVIPRAAPTLSAVRAQRTATGFTITVTGFSSSREMVQGVFRFTGTNLQTTELTVPLTSTFNTWFQSAPSQQFGGQFTLTVPFTTDAGTGTVTGVSVTLTNSVGSSPSVSANF